MTPQLVIFDLDGTLLDTIGDLAVACNSALAVRGLPQHGIDAYRTFVGNGVMRLVERALPEALRTEHTLAGVRADFVRYYTAAIDTYTRPYDGIPEVLKELAQRGVRMAVASNKFQEGTQQLVKLFFGEHLFEVVLGQRPDVALKPDPSIVEEILAVCAVPREQVLFVGDSGIDMQTAAAAGVRSVGVTWGFRSREELAAAGATYIIEHPRELALL